MKSVILFSSMLLITLQGWSQNDAGLIRNDFSQLKNAAFSSNGETAFRHISTESEKYFDHLRYLVLTADSVTVRQLNLVERLHVLIARQSFTAKEVQILQSGKDFFIQLVNKNLVLKSNLLMLDLAEISVTGNEASASIRGSDAANSLKFTKEEDTWKLNVSSLFENAVSGLRLFMLSNDWTEDEFIRRSLRNISGREPRPGIWRAML